MITILIHLRALKTFFGKLPNGFVELYKNELSFHRNVLAVAQQLREGYTPEALARQVCLSEGIEVGSARYHVLLNDAREIQVRFNV